MFVDAMPATSTVAEQAASTDRRRNPERTGAARSLLENIRLASRCRRQLFAQSRAEEQRCATLARLAKLPGRRPPRDACLHSRLSLAFRQQVGLTSVMVAGPVSAGRKRLPITARRWSALSPALRWADSLVRTPQPSYCVAKRFMKLRNYCDARRYPVTVLRLSEFGGSRDCGMSLLRARCRPEVAGCSLAGTPDVGLTAQDATTAWAFDAAGASSAASR